MTLELTLVSNGEPVGTLTVEEADGASLVTYHVDNNGRGARLVERIVLDDGVPTSWEIEGTSLMGGVVHERFAREGPVAAWSSQADEGSTAEQGFYLPADASPFALALLVAHARAAEGRVALLPDGEATVSPVALPGIGDRSIVAHRISGVALHAQHVLIDAVTGSLVGIATGELLLAPDLVEAAPAVQAALQTVEAEHLASIAVDATLHRGSILVRDARIFEPVQGRVLPPQSILIEDGAITAIGESLEAPDGAAVVEAGGRIALPGLHDMHAHLDASSALLYVAAGVTNVRDMGNDNAALAALVESIEAGGLVGPAVTAAGFIEGRSAHAMRMGHVVDSLEGALDAVDWYAERGFHAIKIYNSFTPDWVAPTAARAHEHGMRVQGHVPAFMDADRAIADGYDEITHLNQLALGWVLEPDEDTRTPLRLTALTRVADLDLDAERVQRTIEAMADGGISLDATLVILEQLMLSRARTVIPAHEPIIDHLPAGVRRYRKRTYVPYRDAAELEAYERAFRRLQDIVVRLHAAGVRLWPGTDDGTGVTLHRELELFVDAGISAVDTLRIATLACAEHLGTASSRGAIEVGKTADLVLVDGDPTVSIRDVRQVALVVTGDRVVSPARIHRRLGMLPFAEEATVLH